MKIRSLQALHDLSNSQMGTYLHMSGRSYSRRMQEIGKMQVKDLLAIERVFHTDLLNLGRNE